MLVQHYWLLQLLRPAAMEKCVSAMAGGETCISSVCWWNSPCACSHFTLCTIYRSVRMSKAVIIMLSKHRTENDKLDSLSGELSTVMSHFCIRQGRTRRFTLTLPYFTYSRGRRVTATALRPPGGPMCVPDLTFGLYENLLEFWADFNDRAPL